MFIYQIFIFAVLVACSIYACYTDFKHRKIKNIVSLGLVGFGVFNHGLYFLLGGIIAKENLTTILVVILGGCLIGVFLYVVGVWSAGDAKLFWGFSVAAPPMLFTDVQVSASGVPIMMLENIFVVYLIFVIPNILFKTPRKAKLSVFIENIKNTETLLECLKRAFLDLPCFLILLQGLSFLLGRFLFLYVSPLIIGVFSILIILVFNRYIEKQGLEKYKNFLFILCLAAVLILPSLRGMYLILSPIIFFIAFLLKPFIWESGQIAYVKEINFSTLTAGTIPAERILEVPMPSGHTAYEKEPAVFPKRKKDEVILDVSSKGISQEKVDEVQTLWKNGAFQHLGDTIKVQQHISLAGVICLGCLLTLLCKTTVITYLRYIF